MDNSQIESTINEIRKCSGAVTAFNKDKISNAIFQALAATSKADRGIRELWISIKHSFPKKYENDKKPNHTIGKWYFGESNHQKNNLASWSENFGRFLLNEEKIQNHKSDPESVVLTRLI